MSKPVVKMSRLCSELEKCFRLLNEHFFDNALEAPIITVSPTSNAYGHYTTYDAWTSNGEGKREINIASATLDRPLEEVVATLLHELCHLYNDTVLHVCDSRDGYYHNEAFLKAAVTHGLNCERVPRYGYAFTSPSDELLQFLLDHDEIREIELCRAKEYAVPLSGGKGTDGSKPRVPGTSKSNSRRWVCPGCGAIVRSTKTVNLICGDCLTHFVETV